jgi:signal transduction histidine kinase
MKRAVGVLCLFFLFGVFLVRPKIWASLSSVKYLPHRAFYLIPPGLVWTTVLTDCLVSLAFALIFGGFLWIGRSLRKFPESRPYFWVFLALACFILARGTIHSMNVLTIWMPRWYSFAAGVKLVCAVVSVPTAVLFVLKTPRLVRDFRSVIALRRNLERERDRAHREIEGHEMITAERARAAQDLAEANERLEAVMDSTSDGILKVRYDWTIAYGNRAARLLPDLVLDKNLWECFPGMLSTAAEQHLHTVMKERVTLEYENYYAPYDRWFKTNVSPMEGGISIFFSDMTLAKKLEQELEKERWLREKRIQALSHMAGGLAHEISNPLAIIHGRACDLQDLANTNEPVSAGDVRLASESILHTSDRAIRILRGLRGFARDATQDAMELASIYEIVDECVELQQARLERHKVDLRLALPDGLPYFLCREVQIGQILTNLLNNAFDAVVRTAPAERWIALTARQEEQQIAIEVTDSGAGIAEGFREHLMEPFFTTKGGNLGMGVGLSLSRAIAEDHGGTLILLTEGEHTCFRLSLPVSELMEAATVVG